MEQPYSGVICPEAENEVAIGPDQDRVSSHGRRCPRRVSRIKVASLVVRAGGELEVVAVKMERVFSRIVVVKDYLDDLASLKHKGIRVRAVYGDV